MCPAASDEAALRRLFESSVGSFERGVASVKDTFGLHRLDTPELPRYLQTLRAAAELASDANGAELRLCDLGGYFGILASAISELGYRVHIVDSYGPLLAGDDHSDLQQWWAERGMEISDVDLQSPELRLPFPDNSFDLVTLLAVIEHFPHTPRLVLNEMRRIVKPDGLAIVDTPNAGAFGTRVGFVMHGEGVWSTVSDLYFSEIPFPGHKRCYSRHELVSALEWSGLRPETVKQFDLAAPASNASLRRRLLYGVAYPFLARRFPDVRDYLWVAARDAGA